MLNTNEIRKQAKNIHLDKTRACNEDTLDN